MVTPDKIVAGLPYAYKAHTNRGDGVEYNGIGFVSSLVLGGEGFA